VKLGRKYTTNIKRIKRENNETEQLKTTQKKRVSNWVLQNYMAPNQRIVETRTETHRMKTTNSHSDGSRTHLPLDLTKLHGTKTKLQGSEEEDVYLRLDSTDLHGTEKL